MLEASYPFQIVAAAALFALPTAVVADTKKEALEADCTVFMAADIDPQLMRPDVAQFYTGVSTVLDIMYDYYLAHEGIETGIPFNELCLEGSYQSTEKVLEMATEAFLDSVAAQADPIKAEDGSD